MHFTAASAVAFEMACSRRLKRTVLFDKTHGCYPEGYLDIQGLLETVLWDLNGNVALF